MEKRGTHAYVAEFVGTLLLVLFITLVVSLTTKAALGYTDYAVVGLVHAFLLMMLIASLGSASGAHFNPAVTVTLFVLRKIRGADAAIYIVLQLLGGIAGAFITKAVLVDEGRQAQYGAGAVSQFLSGSTGAGFAMEAIGTFVLMWAIMGVAVNVKAHKSWAPWVIGATLGFAVMCIGPLTGAGLNPARALGPALAGDFFGGFGRWFVIYALGPIVGALIAGLVYQYLIIDPDQEQSPIETYNETTPDTA